MTCADFLAPTGSIASLLNGLFGSSSSFLDNGDVSQDLPKRSRALLPLLISLSVLALVMTDGVGQGDAEHECEHCNDHAPLSDAPRGTEERRHGRGRSSQLQRSPTRSTKAPAGPPAPPSVPGAARS